MFWIFPASLAYFFWAVENVGNKYVFANKSVHTYVFAIWFSLASLGSVGIIPFIDFRLPPLHLILLIFASGAIYFLAGLPYYKALEIEEVTRINIWWGLIPIFSFVLGWGIIGDTLSFFEIVSFIILLASSVLAGLHLGGKRVIFSPAFTLMILSTFLYALQAVLTRYATMNLPYLVVYVWFIIGSGCAAASLLFFSRFRRPFVRETKNMSWSLGVTIFGLVIFSKLGLFCSQWALSLRQTALVYALKGVQVLFVFGLTFIIAKKYPTLLQESLDKKDIFLKLIALVLVVLGIVVLVYAQQ